MSDVLGGFTGTFALVRHSLRRDRVFWPSWLMLLTIQMLATAVAYEDLYPTPLSRRILTGTVATNPSLRALYGPAFDLSSGGGFVAWRIYGLALVMSGIMSVMAIVRHTRAEEESGRLEMLRAGVVGRHASLTAALAVTVAGNAVLGAACGFGLMALGQSGPGSMSILLGTTLTGAVFAGVAAVTAQISENARPARGIAVAVIGLAYVLRAFGDSSNTAPWLSWISPLGWPQHQRPYAQERWWVLILPAVLACVLVTSAYLLESRRDFASGLRSTPLGPARADRRLLSPEGLAWRLERASWFAWIAGIAAISSIVGAIANGVLDIFRENPNLEEIFRRMGGSTSSLIDAFFAAILPVIGIIATIHAVQIVLRLRAEETDLLMEQLLATAATRTRVVFSQLVHAIVSPVILMLVAGFFAGLTYGLSVHDESQIGRITMAALATAPAMLVVAGVAALLVGVLPRAAGLTWAVLALSVLIGQIGPLLKLPNWALRISPYGNVPSLPGGHASMTPLAVMGVLGVVLSAAGVVGFRSRDIGAA